MHPQIVLYGNSKLTSPYVLSVFVALEEKGLPYRLELLDLGQGEQHRPEFAQRSITNRVPTLHIRDSQHDLWLSESVAITEYLEERFPPPQYTRLYPENLAERARVRMVQGLIRSDFMPIREERATETIFAGAPIRPLSERAEAARQRLVRIATALVPEGQNFIAREFSIADVDFATLLQRLAHHRDPLPPRLVEYAQAIWQRPSVRTWLALTNYPG
jgi:glutathione S-transferase